MRKYYVYKNGKHCLYYENCFVYTSKRKAMEENCVNYNPRDLGDYEITTAKKYVPKYVKNFYERF